MGEDVFDYNCVSGRGWGLIKIKGVVIIYFLLKSWIGNVYRFLKVLNMV